MQGGASLVTRLSTHEIFLAFKLPSGFTVEADERTNNKKCEVTLCLFDLSSVSSPLGMQQSKAKQATSC